eukprot:6652660-Pyramimonas_sp.AAC.1
MEAGPAPCAQADPLHCHGPTAPHHRWRQPHPAGQSPRIRTRAHGPSSRLARTPASCSSRPTS